MKQNTLTIDEFVTALKKQVRDCAFGKLKDDMVLHALTLGLSHERTRRRLFERESLTLDKAIDMCRLAEDTEEEMRKLKINEEVNAVYKTKPKAHEKAKTFANKSQFKSSDNKAERSCGRCGMTHPVRQCPAYGKECHICKML